MKKRASLALLAAFAVILAIAIPALSTGTVGTLAGFEDDDANLAVNSTFDWNGFKPTTWTGTAPYRVSAKVASGWNFAGIEDAQNLATDTAFAGGTKQDKECATVITQKSNNKDDLKRIYLASKTVSGHTFLMLAWARIPQNSTSPSAHVAFEFNRGTTACGGSGGLVHRSTDDLTTTGNDSDMLIVYDFEGGAGSPTLKLSRWIASGTCEVGSNSPPCWGVATTLPAGVAEAAVDTGLSGLPSSALDEIGPSGNETLGTSEFGEAGVDLTAAGVFTAGTCSTFGKAFGVSRTSGQSSTAQMKDLVGPGNFTLTNCATVNVTKTGSDSGSQAGAVFTLYSGSDTTGTVIGTCTVDVNGQCGPNNPSFQNLQPGTYTLDETTVPTGYTKDATLPFTFTLNAADTKNFAFVDVAQPGSVNISKVDDAGDPVDGAVFSIYSPAGTTLGVPTGALAGSCTTSGGSCTISNVTPGTYTLDETVPTGYAKDSQFPQDITVANGQTVTINATNPRQFKVIVIVCRQTDNTLYPSGITIDGQARPDSLSSAGATAASLSESALCGLTAGARGGLLAAPDASNPHSASVDIPNSQI